MRLERTAMSVELLVRIVSALVRAVPIRRRIPAFFIKRSLHFRGHRLDYAFYCRNSGVRWSARGFPDLMTRHMMFEGSYQESVLSAIRVFTKPGDTIFDVGGHHGLMAIVANRAAGASGTVVTFEPNPAARQYLQQHLELNRATRVIIEPVVLSDRNGEVPFFVQTGDVTWNSSLVREFVDSECRVQPIIVESRTLDHYVAETGRIPSLVKIDVEGSELTVLKGAVNTIQAHHPILVTEFNPRSAERGRTTIAEMVAFLEANSYRLVVPKRNALGYYRLSKSEPFREVYHCGGGELRNVVCIPDRGDAST
jgi:FkbM family methyltransferase